MVVSEFLLGVDEIEGHGMDHGGTFALINICGEKENDGNALFSSAFSYDLSGDLHGIVLDFWLYRFSGCFL